MDLSHLVVAEIPADGLHLEGTLPAEIFDIDPADALATAPLSYALDLLPTGDCILATGAVTATFRRECVRCLEPFSQTIALDPYSADIEIDASPTINLTARLREDILLSLPAYPRCESSSDGRKCPAADRFRAAEPAPPEPDDGKPSGAWDVLGEWKQPPTQD